MNYETFFLQRVVNAQEARVIEEILSEYLGRKPEQTDFLKCGYRNPVILDNLVPFSYELTFDGIALGIFKMEMSWNAGNPTQSLVFTRYASAFIHSKSDNNA